MQDFHRFKVQKTPINQKKSGNNFEKKKKKRKNFWVKTLETTTQVK